ncbi:hypothetical protein HYH03_009376 [Edaphochlamys debaryana]|uniref:Uncharacterized protein n=1 Tax=Edaphochlamys debaryana TaxID=47281 RepID=A0A836BYL3_9CHLO|nr:hypothetical protein HYH03_009376 [Edaphochlamys debaryana]|eukprot:KAG2492433.1 hypothetical protein HYH03_009376 [Edaphochlamys debaryana]
MSLSEYLKGVEKLQAFSAGSDAPSTFTSYDTQRTAWVRHERVDYEATKTLRAPMTTSQEVGWHANKVAPPEASQRRTLGSTDVTRKEGNTAASYYGHFICGS